MFVCFFGVCVFCFGAGDQARDCVLISTCSTTELYPYCTFDNVQYCKELNDVQGGNSY